MKVSLSRKGFDSSAGGCASPILPDGTLVPLPIPCGYGKSATTYDALGLGEYVRDLTRGRLTGASAVHHDPDFRTGCFGQAGAAARHLAGHGFGPGDLFVFFGWFREVERTEGGRDGRWRFVPGAPDRHIVFGWLQVGAVFPLPEARAEVPACAAGHPHLEPFFDRPGVLYTAADHLRLPGLNRLLPGRGLFTGSSQARVLTWPGAPRSRWRLPATLMPGRAVPPLRHHADARRWRRRAGAIELDTAKRGQEFVLDLDAWAPARDWIVSMFAAT
jgi:hypothetical protein